MKNHSIFSKPSWMNANGSAVQVKLKKSYPLESNDDPESQHSQLAWSLTQECTKGESLFLM